MKAGIIGCGSIAQVHAWALSQMEDTETAVFCDTENSKAEELAEKFAGAGCRIETDWHKLCSADVDVVHICTPHYLHAPMAAELLDSGKAVFLEKPCAVTRAQYLLLCEADRKHPDKLGICFQNRYNATIETADRILAEGRIGDIIGARAFVTWRRDENYYTGSSWKGRKETEGGGALINQAIHTLDLLLRYMGRPEQLKASVSNHHLQGVTEVEDTVEAWMSFEGGKRACFYASNGYAADAPVILEIQGEKGRIMICDNEVSLWTAEKGSEHMLCEEKRGYGKDYWGSGHLACIRDFYEAIEQRRAPRIGLKDAEITFDTMMRIYENAAGVL